MLAAFLLQLELLAIVNLLQLVFLGIRLDSVVMWKWTVSEQLTPLIHSLNLCC